jgi:hypothetical protein
MPSVDVFAQWAVALLGVGGGGKFAYDMITARQAGRKGKTEGAVMLVDSASGFAQTLVARLDAVEREFAAYKRQDEIYRRQQDRLFRQHSRWDDELVERLEDLGEHISPPPPLYIDTDAEEERTPR